MAAQYYLYCTTLNNTVIERSDSSFAPLPPNTGELLFDILIPETQPLYLYRESGSTIIYNTQENVEEYIDATELPPTAAGNVTYGEFTGTTAILSASTENLYATKVNLSGDTMTGSLSTTSNLFANGTVTGSSICGGVWVHSPIICATTRVQSPIISGSTCSIAPITIGTSCVCSPRILGSVSVCSPIVSGSTCVTGTISCATTRMQSPIVCGSTCSISPITCGTTCVTTPVLFGSTCSNSPLHCGACVYATTRVCSPIITGSTCVTGAISCATTRMQSPIVCGSTCSTSPITCGTTCVMSPFVCGTTRVQSPILCSSTCLCSTGTAGFTDVVTAASTLNVSGNTTLGAQLYLNTVSTGGTLSDYTVVWNPTTKQMRTISPQGSACVYCYVENDVRGNNATTTNATYLTASWSLASGTYEIEYNALFGNNTSNRCAIVCFLLDGNIVGSCNLMKTNDTNVIATSYVTRDCAFATTTTHTPSIVYRQCGGGTAFITYAAIRFKKIGA